MPVSTNSTPAICDEDGYFFVVDRKKDMFISGGENVCPAKIEKVFYLHPAVQICVMIGLPDPNRAKRARRVWYSNLMLLPAKKNYCNLWLSVW